MSQPRHMACRCTSDTANCAALRVDPIDTKRSETLAAGFKALGDAHRMGVLHLLSGAGEPVCVVDIERHFSLSQSTISYHLKALVDADIIERERRGRWSYYSVKADKLEVLSRAAADYAARVTSLSSL
jgi:ArsR family transcriptional regulator, arsenate/arsenite/antimonite-responsive transcriptional repressor